MSKEDIGFFILLAALILALVLNAIQNI